MEWIMTKDKLPNNMERILFVVDVYQIRSGVFLEKDFFNRDDIFCGDGFFKKESVSHWMPLPEPPKTKHK